jgi:type I restriction enzyme S subunit
VANTEQGFFRLLLGFAARVPSTFGTGGIYSHHLYRVIPRKGSPLTPNFLYFLFNTQKYHGVISGYGNGTTVNMLPPDALKRPSVVVPSESVVRVFDRITEPMLARIEANHVENDTLAHLRDTLLPKLISGEVRVPVVDDQEPLP